jgi:hypothetical protein
MSYLGKIINRNQFHLLINELGLRNGVEIGVQVGGFSKYLLENTFLFMCLVDPWIWIDGYDDVSNAQNDVQDIRLQMTRSNLFGYEDRYRIFRRFSVDAVKEFADSSIDFIYIDANHDYKHCTEDLNLWFPKVKNGGLIAGHDFLDSGFNFGVRSAVLDFLKDKPYKLYNTLEDWPSFYFIKSEM